MVGLADMSRTPSALDLATVVHSPDGRRVYMFPDAEADAAERAARQQYADAHADLERVKAREAYISGRVKQFVANRPSDAGTARDRLFAHVRWMDQARHQATVAGNKVLESATAAARHDAAKLELETIEGEIRLAQRQWVDHAADIPRPDPRTAEQDVQREIMNATRWLAGVADEAAVQAQVAQEVVRVLGVMHRGCVAAVVEEVEGATIDADLKAALAIVEAKLGEQAALDEATASPDYSATAELASMGVAERLRLLPPPNARIKVGIPGQQPFVIKVDAVAQERFRDAMHRLTRDPEADISPMPSPDDPPPTPPGRKPLAAALKLITRK